MLDADLAEIYGYETRYLNRQVARNRIKFEGEEFMFRLTRNEFNDLMCQNGTSKIYGRGGTRKLPYAFTEIRRKMNMMDDEVRDMTNRIDGGGGSERCYRSFNSRNDD